jgi:hypothetical protein
VALFRVNLGTAAAGNLSEESYVADSVREKKFRKAVIGVAPEVEKCALRNGKRTTWAALPNFLQRLKGAGNDGLISEVGRRILDRELEVVGSFEVGQADVLARRVVNVQFQF